VTPTLSPVGSPVWILYITELGLLMRQNWTLPVQLFSNSKALAHNSGMALIYTDDDCDLYLAGDSICIQPYNPGNPNQQWMVAGNRVQNRFNPNLNLDIAGAEGDPGARVCAWDYHGGANQQWSAEYTAPRYFFIRSAMNGKVLDIRGADSSPGTKVIMYDQNDGMSDNQLWYEDQYGIIRSKLNDFAVDATEGSMRMEPYDPSNSQQQWVISGDRIVNRHNDQMCCDIKGADDSNGAKLCAYNAHGGDNQRWSIDFI